MPASLDLIEVPVPCLEPWSWMRGDERTRFCRLCQKNVHNPSAMSRAETQELLLRASDGTCVRFYRRPDGTVMTARCRSPFVPRPLKYFAVAYGLFLGYLVAVGCQNRPTTTESRFVGRLRGYLTSQFVADWFTPKSPPASKFQRGTAPPVRPAPPAAPPDPAPK